MAVLVSSPVLDLSHLPLRCAVNKHTHQRVPFITAIWGCSLVAVGYILQVNPGSSPCIHKFWSVHKILWDKLNSKSYCLACP